jgi:hypothetical protein
MAERVTSGLSSYVTFGFEASVAQSDAVRPGVIPSLTSFEVPLFLFFKCWSVLLCPDGESQ